MAPPRALLFRDSYHLATLTFQRLHVCPCYDNTEAESSYTWNEEVE